MGRQYEEMASYENLYRAWKLARRGKSADHEVQKFALEASARLWKLHDSLEKRQYQPMGYYHFTVYEPKKREIYAPYFEDRVVQHSLCDNVLRPWMEARLIYDCAACRIGKGTHFAMDRLSGFLREFYREHGIKGYVLKCDIRKYFDNVDHDILKKRLSKFPDKEVLHLLHQFIISKHDFDLVQRIRRIDTRTSPKEDKVYLFSGILICGCCGGRMTRKINRYKDKEYVYYFCPSGKKHGCTSGAMVKESDLIQCVQDSLKGHIDNIASLDTMLSSISQERINRELAREYAGQIGSCEKQLAQIEKYKAKLYENLVGGILTKEEFLPYGSTWSVYRS